MKPICFAWILSLYLGAKQILVYTLPEESSGRNEYENICFLNTKATSQNLAEIKMAQWSKSDSKRLRRRRRSGGNLGWSKGLVTWWVVPWGPRLGTHLACGEMLLTQKGANSDLGLPPEPVTRRKKESLRDLEIARQGHASHSVHSQCWALCHAQNSILPHDLVWNTREEQPCYCPLESLADL